MEEFAIGIKESNRIAIDAVRLCIKTDFGLQNNRKPTPEEVTYMLIMGGFVEIRKF